MKAQPTVKEPWEYSEVDYILLGIAIITWYSLPNWDAIMSWAH